LQNERKSVAQLLKVFENQGNLRGCSSVGRASALQAILANSGSQESTT